MKLNNDLYEYDKAAALLAILDILRRFGDDHNKREMQDKLLDEYGISVSRNTFASKLRTLDRCGYTLRESEDGTHYIFEGREFTDAQLRVLIDCLINNGVVGSETAKKMISELCDLGSESLRNSCGSFQKRVAGRKRSSDAVTENLGIIQRAIGGNAKILCNYKVYNKMLNLVNKYPKDITVSPFELTLANGRYILICAVDGQDDLSHFYIDKLCDIRLIREPALNARKFLSALGYNDMNEYISSQPVLCGGRKERFTLKIDNSIINDFIEDFGGEFRKLADHRENDGYATVLTITTSQDSLRRLITPYLDKIVVLNRPEFYDSIKELYDTGMHNHRMIGKDVRIRSLGARTLEEALRVCEVNDLHFIHLISRKTAEKLDLSPLVKADQISSVSLLGYDLTGQRFPAEMTELKSLSLVRCKYDMETVTELENVTELRLGNLSADDLSRLSEKKNLTRLQLLAYGQRRNEIDIEKVGDVKDLGFLKDWNDLKSLEITDYPGLEDISALEDKTGLRTLIIGGSPKIKDIGFVKNMTELRRLIVTGCSVPADQIEEIKKALPGCSVCTERPGRYKRA
ncbi:MAG: WYL domain-containing protein [Ruminococcus sp.]|nr:WYL domain-containing protein [Ruminococcus sp.]